MLKMSNQAAIGAAGRPFAVKLGQITSLSRRATTFRGRKNVIAKTEIIQMWQVCFVKSVSWLMKRTQNRKLCYSQSSSVACDLLSQTHLLNRRRRRHDIEIPSRNPLLAFERQVSRPHQRNSVAVITIIVILKASPLIYNTTRPTCCSYVTRRDFSFLRMLPNPTGRTTENRSRSRLPASPASCPPPNPTHTHTHWTRHRGTRPR